MSFHTRSFQFKLPEAFLTLKPLGGFPLTEGWVYTCKPSIFKKYYSVDVSVHFTTLMDIRILPYFFAITRSLPKHTKIFQISMEKMVYTINSFGGSLPYKL